MQQHVARTWMSHFRLCSLDGRQRRRHPGWVYYDPTSGGDGPSAGRKRRLIREEGFASRVSSHVRPQDSGGGGGGGTVMTVSPRRMTIDDVSHTMELSGGGGGGLSWSPPGF